MQPRQKLYELIKAEMKRRGRWKNKDPGAAPPKQEPSYERLLSAISMPELLRGRQDSRLYLREMCRYRPHHPSSGTETYGL